MAPTSPPRPARIASRANPQFKALRALSESAAERRRLKRTLLDGVHLVGAYLQHSTPLLVAVSESALDNPEVVKLLRRSEAAPQIRLPRELFDQLAPVRTPTGILAAIDTPLPRAASPGGELIVLLDGVQDPGNVGTIIRAAAAADASAVLLSADCADAWSPRTLRAAMGAHFALDVYPHCDLARSAAEFSGRLITSAGRGGSAPSAIDLTGKVALVFGSEGSGVGAALAASATATVSIPLARGIESLNVGAAAAIVLFERVRQTARRATRKQARPRRIEPR